MIGSDSAGKPLRDVIGQHLAARGVPFVEMSPPAGGAPEFDAHTAERVGLAVARREFERGILFRAIGIGVCIAANKVPGIRGAHPRHLFGGAGGGEQQRPDHHASPSD